MRGRLETSQETLPEGAVYDAKLCRSASRTLEARVLGNARKPRSRTRCRFRQPAAGIVDRRRW
eukprot:400585-Pyramimonas_sp.AAC.1